MRIKKIEFTTSMNSKDSLPFLTKSINFFETKNKFDNRNYNLSLLLGENGTRKTTILNLIADLFNNDHIFNSKYKNVPFSISLNNQNKDEIFCSNSIYETNFDCHYLTTSLLNNVTNEITSNTEFIENTSRSLVEFLLKNNSIMDTLKLVDYPILELFIEDNIYVECIRYNTIRNSIRNNRTQEKINSITDETITKLCHTADSLGIDHTKSGDIVDVINSIIPSLNSRINRYSINVNRYGVQKNYKALPFDFFKYHNSLFQILDSLDIPDIYSLSTRRRFGNLRYVREIWFPLRFEKIISISQLSSGELSFLSHLLELNKVRKNKNSIILIDEPELHLHPRWIRFYTSILDTFFKNSNSHVIVATHSPLLVNQVFEENLVLLKKKDGISEQVYVNKNPLGMRIDDLLNEVFYLSNNNTALEDYKLQLIKQIKNTESRLVAIEEYNSLEDSLLKFDIFKACYKEIKESRG
ncbi:AAA family ATPase [Enterococcus sp. LJL120]